MSKRVLVIDDSKMAVSLIGKIFTDLGYEVVGTASDGEEGLARYQELKPDIVATDSEMPNLSGIELIKRIRQQDSGVHILLITSISNQQLWLKAQSLQVTPIKKPISKGSLYRVLKTLSDEEKPSPIAAPVSS